MGLGQADQPCSLFKFISQDPFLAQEIYYNEDIDKQLSCSNVGGRKGRNIRDHLFVIYGVINDVKNGKAGDIDIQGYDINKCFDEMNYEETHNDLWDVGVHDDCQA